MWDKFISWFTGEPIEYVRCNKGNPGGRHPMFERLSRTKLIPELSAIDAYEECGLCGKEWHEGDL